MPLAERLEPRLVIELLNRYFVSMEQAISPSGGFIDSFAGDEIKALFDTTSDQAVAGGIAMAGIRASHLQIKAHTASSAKTILPPVPRDAYFLSG